MQKLPSTKVMEIFSDAATRAGTQRSAFLDTACREEPDVRAEVESLLATQDQLDGFLGEPTVEIASIGEVSGEGIAAADLLEADHVQIGRYDIVKRIGEGGFGVVYHARQNHPIQRDVALKIVKLGMDTRQIISRFESERQALALMDHPNIARIFDAGATPDGRPYFVMELVEGLPITEYCDAHCLPVSERLQLFIAVCQAVQHAHQKGIIHRDLKPSNILVLQTDTGHVPKVIDFGIAKAMEARPGAQTAATEVRHFLGTPQYMSPEQAGAGTGDIDTRSDIYALGVLLYELLIGTTPFDPNLLAESSYEQVHRIIREEEPVKPSVRLTTIAEGVGEIARRRATDEPKLRRAIAGELDWIVTKALEKDRANRYETASAVADDVRRYLVGEPVRAGAPDTIYRIRKFAARHRRPLLAMAAVMLALLLGLAGTTFGLLRAKRDRDRAEAALAQAEQISGFLAEMLRSADPDRAKTNSLSMQDVIDRSSRSIEQGALKDQPLVEAGIRMALGGAYESLGRYPESEVQVRKALSIRQRLLGNENRLTAQSMAAVAWSMANRADREEAEKLTREALAIQERILGPRHPETVATLIRLGLILRGKRAGPGAEEVFRRAVNYCRNPGINSDMAASAITNLAVVLMDKGDNDGAEPLFHEALALNRAAHGDRYRNVARNLGNLSVIRNSRGDLNGSEQFLLESLRLQRDLLPAIHPDIGWTLRLLGKLKYAQGNLAEAEKYFRDSIEIERRVFGSQHPIVHEIQYELSEVLDKEGRSAEALAIRKEADEARLSRAASLSATRPDAVPQSQPASPTPKVAAD